MIMELKEIYRPISRELKQVQSRLNAALQSSDRSISRLARYAVKSPGKQLRPALLLLSAKTGGRDLRRAIELAAAMELVHTATLIHDDIIDGARVRRGKLSISARYGRGKAILLGDYLFSKAFELVAAVELPQIMKKLIEVSMNICRGELKHMAKAFKPLSEQAYLEVVNDKTAALFAACCETGAISAGAGPVKAAALRRYGQNLGICFQIVDDCLDLAGPAQKTGKSARLDKKSGKMTLPLIYLSKHQGANKSAAVRYSLAVADGFRKKALSAISRLPDNELKRSLAGLADFIMDQKNLMRYQ